MLSRLRSKKGFTLIELMIVVAIIGILAAIAIPNFLRFQAKSRQSEAKTNLGGIFTAQTAYLGEHNRYGTFTEIAWAPIGTSQRYTYYSGSNVAGGTSGTGDFVAAPAPIGQIAWQTVNGVTPGQTVPAGAVAGQFTAGAIGNVDTDATNDIWAMTENRALRNVQDDVATP
ncbi:MAG TPA: prepilin-type N-terminal cleavage/methylation domain-containing protein [Candidatus Deferrimicrobiaceae bacterium]